MGWPATKATRVLRALIRLGWTVERQRGSQRALSGWPRLIPADMRLLLGGHLLGETDVTQALYNCPVVQSLKLRIAIEHKAPYPGHRVHVRL